MSASGERVDDGRGGVSAGLSGMLGVAGLGVSAGVQELGFRQDWT